MEEFTRDIEELVLLFNTTKNAIHRNLKKNYQENIQYIVLKHDIRNGNIMGTFHGGHNKRVIMLTETAFNLFKNSYNIRNRYITTRSDNVSVVNSINMCIENQTIGFIWNCFNEITPIKRQYRIDTYIVDLYFIEYNLAIECDENGHSDRDPNYEKTREKFIISLGNKMIRFNPNIPSFDLSNVIKDINHIIFNK
jgi:hypothetical protein